MTNAIKVIDNESVKVGATTYGKEYAFINKSLAKHIKAMRKATQAGRKAMIEVSRHIVEIVNEESWKDDFKTQAEFCKFIGCSSSDVSNKKLAVKFFDNHPEAEQLEYSIRRATEYQKLEDAGKLEDFQKYCITNAISINSDGKLLKAIKQYSGLLTDGKKSEDADIVSETEHIKAVKSSDTAGGKKMVCLEYDGKTYSIPAKEFKAFLEDYSE